METEKGHFGAPECFAIIFKQDTGILKFLILWISHSSFYSQVPVHLDILLAVLTGYSLTSIEY